MSHPSVSARLRDLLLLPALAAALLSACDELSNDAYGDTCTTDEDCPGFTLTCFEVPRTGERLCLTHEPGPAGTDCVDELECNAGLRCDVTTGTCGSGDIGLPECSTSADCPTGEICQGDQCVAGTECANNADCDADETCDGGRCVSSEPECTSDAQCGQGMSCWQGGCVENAECTSDADCVPGRVCEAGYCVSGPPPCESDADCDDGESCIDGDCLGDVAECESDADCDEGEQCNAGICEDLECDRDADCGVGFVCEGGYCVEDSGFCENDSDCGEGWYCLGAECVEADCMDDSDCGPSEACVAYTCEAVTTCGTDAHCGPEMACADGVCRQLARYVAIVSLTADAGDVGNSTPGPDMDAIALLDSRGMVAEWVLSIAATAGGGSDSNNFDNASAALGESDAILDDGTCDLDDSEPKFYSMGGGDEELGEIGYMVADFDTTLRRGWFVKAYELDEEACDNVSTTRNDQYEIWIGNAEDGPIDEAHGWLRLGASEDDGGVTSIEIDY